jgi:hypothetical protein
VFADSPSGSRDDDASDASEGKEFLLHIANAKEANDSAARAVDDPSPLLERAASVTNLARALLNVARNKGAAGVDGHSVEEIVADAPRLGIHGPHQIAGPTVRSPSPASRLSCSTVGCGTNPFLDESLSSAFDPLGKESPKLSGLLTSHLRLHHSPRSEGSRIATNTTAPRTS